jgi:hypothetical protein
LALSKLTGGHLEVITDSRAVIRYRSGGVLTWCRGSSGLGSALLWWEAATIIGAFDRETDGGVA